MSQTNNDDPRFLKIDRWGQHLLDLSLRNRLINLKPGRQAILLESDNIASLEDLLHQKTLPFESRLKEAPAEDDDLSYVSVDFFEDETDPGSLRTDDGSIDVADSDSSVKTEKKQSDRLKPLDGSRLWSRLSSAELNKSLLTLYRQSRTDLDEGGVNTLFLALGVLEWNELNKTSGWGTSGKKESGEPDISADSCPNTPESQDYIVESDAGGYPSASDGTVDFSVARIEDNSTSESQTETRAKSVSSSVPSDNNRKKYLAPIILVPVQLERQSARLSYKLKLRDEDTVINATLLEFLRRDAGITFPEFFGEIPTDDYGVDVTAILDVFSQKIAVLPGWSVKPELWLARFSFNKYIMYTDLNDRWQTLANNPMVARLIDIADDSADKTEKGPIEADIIPEPLSTQQDETSSGLDAELPFRENACASRLFLPVSADASQTQAVLRSQSGESFVLYGPPGTGKSQTITNLIAHNLAMGRRVLFVSEKRAALEVVYNRLSKIGLAPFCLELHSNKAGKKETLAQFDETLRLAEQPNNSADWQKTCKQIDATGFTLDSYVKILHQPYANGLSGFDCIGWILSQQAAQPPRYPSGIQVFSPDSDFSRFSISDSRRLVERIQEHADDFSASFVVGMAAIKSWTWSSENQTLLLEASQKTRSALDNLNCQAQSVFQMLDPAYAETSFSFEILVVLPKLLNFLKSSQPILPSFGTPDFKKQSARLENWISCLTNYAAARERLQGFDLSRIVNAPLDDLQKKLEYNNGRFFLFRYIANSILLKEWRFIKRSDVGAPLTVTELTTLLPAMRCFKAAYWELKKEQSNLAPLFGFLWQGEQTDFADLIVRLTRSRELQAILDQANLTPDQERCFVQFAKDLLENHTGAPDPAVIQAFEAALTGYDRAKHELQTRVELSDASLPAINLLLDAILENPDKLRGFSFYQNLLDQARQSGLTPFIHNLEAGKIDDLSHLVDVFDLEYRQQTLTEIMAQSPEYNRFSALNQQQTIETYRQLYDKYMAQTQQQVVHLLYKNVKSILDKAQLRGNSLKAELALLRKEIGKKMRHIPIRFLLERAPRITNALKPCLLMSPLSVAQYLPADHASFDLVVFDEASQITTWDAVGVIARGNQLIVVGDPQQMPPTNFFQKQETGDFDNVDESVNADLESILDECIALGVPGCNLNTHYRSRHESLIAFSNHFYYQDKLSTFPSASMASEQLGIQFVYVPEGVYDRCKTRTNRAEAEKLVEIICNRLKDPKTAKKSIGVVTFSLSQKSLIDDLLEQAAQQTPELDAAMSEDNPEPLFVKNLESVQGDERDCMLFAVGYGPDERGKVAMNFGPLNRMGGQRRLNVAITRAKYQIIVVSSLRAEHIDLSRTQALGAIHLKEFLQYAQTGRPGWESPNRNQNELSNSTQNADFASFVAQFLEQSGYRVVRNLGMSNYTIDLAVEDPKNANQYKWAIECDGPVYRDAPDTRERDILRGSVLRGLGWQTLRIWSVEWYHDCEKAKKQLLERLKKS